MMTEHCDDDHSKLPLAFFWLAIVCWSQMQARKGGARDSLSVLDFGDVRVAVSCDMAYFDTAEVLA